MTNLIPWRDSHLVEEARREFDDVFRRVFGPLTENGNGNRKMTWSPHIDMSESDKSIIVKADVPGVDPKDIDVTVQNGVLTLTGEKKEEREEKQKNYQRTERFFGQFYRAIALPTGVDENNVAATTSKGVITITIPKKPDAQPKKVTIKAAE